MLDASKTLASIYVDRSRRDRLRRADTLPDLPRRGHYGINSYPQNCEPRGRLDIEAQREPAGLSHRV